VRRVALALALVLVAAGVVALAESGCSTTQATGVRAERPVDTTPDGGWQAYTPAGPQYGPNPAEAAMGQPTISPFGLAGTDVH
jgi:hypothetical protein